MSNHTVCVNKYMQETSWHMHESSTTHMLYTQFYVFHVKINSVWVHLSQNSLPKHSVSFHLQPISKLLQKQSPMSVLMIQF